jgi:hypothetical protein
LQVQFRSNGVGKRHRKGISKQTSSTRDARITMLELQLGKEKAARDEYEKERGELGLH